MKRKLISMMLSVFAMLLLMGAAADTEPAAALVAEEESAVSQESELETEAQFPDEGSDLEVPDEGEADASEPSSDDPYDYSNSPMVPPIAVTGDSKLLINGRPAPLELNKELQNGVTYVSLSVMTRQLAPTAEISWDGSAARVVTDQLTLTAEIGRASCRERV